MKEIYTPEVFSRSAEKNKKGEDVVIHIVFIRHGEKEHDPTNNNTPLTEKGIQQGREFGSSRQETDMIKSYVSPTKRTEDTGNAIVSANNSKKGVLRERDELAFPYEEGGQFDRKISQLKKEIIGDDPLKLTSKELNEKVMDASNGIINFYLDFDKDKPEDKTVRSPREIASKTSKLLLHYLNMSKRLISNSEVDLINVTHDLNIVSFLKYFFEDQINTGEKFKIEDSGGPINFVEGYEIKIERKNADNFEIKLSFRGQEYTISEEFLEKTASAEYEK